MDVHIFCDSKDHPIKVFIDEWLSTSEKRIKLYTNLDQLVGGNILILVSCNTVIKPDYFQRYQKSFVLHASDLPEGRGWSPHIWTILEGKEEIVLSLIEANEIVDTGDIWLQKRVPILKTDLYDEINYKLFNAEIDLVDQLIKNFKLIEPIPQVGKESYYKKRSPKDSELDINASIEQQIDLIRVCDPKRYPAFFYYEGIKYNISIEKAEL